MMRLRDELAADGLNLQLVFIHQKDTEDWIYKIVAAINGDVPLLQDVASEDVRVQLQAERGDMYLYGKDRKLAMYLLARRADYDFNEDDGYARFKADVAAQF